MSMLAPLPMESTRAPASFQLRSPKGLAAPVESGRGRASKDAGGVDRGACSRDPGRMPVPEIRLSFCPPGRSAPAADGVWSRVAPRLWRLLAGMGEE
jgi:hypothetical protein